MDDHALHTDVLRTRAMLSYMLAKLEDEVHRSPDAETLNPKLWGKADVLTALTRLSIALLRYIPLEKNMRAPVDKEVTDVLEPEDRAIYDRHHERHET